MKTLRLSGSSMSDIARAGEIIRAGGVVAIPTETVYGLAANALDGGAVRKVFAAKGRPADNPLIVHICEAAQLDGLCGDIPQMARELAKTFWPGPLTLVLRAAQNIPSEVTAGLDTVGIRMPAHETALAAIRAANVPLAAPSANISGTPSPTSAAHVLSDFSGKIDAVLDGGVCRVGLESTVLDLTAVVPTILRPGAVTKEMLVKIIGDVDVYSGAQTELAPRSPGLKYRHYSTRAPLTLFSGAPDDTAAEIFALASDYKGSAVICFDEYFEEMRSRFGEHVYSMGESFAHETHASRLFSLLRTVDSSGANAVLVQCPRPFGRGAASANRLTRAAGESVVHCTKRAVIGVTGASGSGKSALSRAIAALGGQANGGAAVFDADAIYKRLLRENAQMRAALAAHFPEADAGNGQVDLAALRNTVFADSSALTQLNHITHPFVAREIASAIRRTNARVCVLDVPILFGSAIDRICTMTVGVLAPYEQMLSRIIARDGIDESAARSRLAARQSEQFIRERCDILAENDGDELELERIANRIFSSL